MEVDVEDDPAKRDRVQILSSMLDDLDASTKLSRTRTDELLNASSRSRSTSPPHSPKHQPTNRNQSRTTTNRRDLSEIQENSEDEELYSDLDEMINKMPSDEEPDPNMSPAQPIQSTPLPNSTARSQVSRDLFNLDDPSPVRSLKSAQKPPATKTPAKTVDFQSPTVPVSPDPMEKKLT